MSGEREARLWFAQALADLDTARDNAASHPDASCFMAHQAAEKAFKALEMAAAGGITHTHSLDVLYRRVRDLRVLSADLGRKAIRDLEQKNREARYPDMLIDTYPAAYFTEEDAREAIASGHEIVEAVRRDLPFDA